MCVVARKCGMWSVLPSGEGGSLYGGERSTSFPRIQYREDWSTAQTTGNEMAAATACNIHEILPSAFQLWTSPGAVLQAFWINGRVC